jgi:hypothetical protein
MDFIKCPECNGNAYFDTVDIGVGYQQITPATCSCGWFQGCDPGAYLKFIGEAADNVQ